MTDENLIYVNVNLTNNMQPQPLLARVVDRRDSPILMCPRDFEMAIVRFQINISEVPLFIPTIPNPAFPLQTNMSVTLNYMGNYFRQFINVSPQEAKSGIFNYQDYLQELNTASDAAFTALKTAFPAAPGTVAPLFYLSPTTGLISMYVQDSYLESNAPNVILIGFNEPLQNIMGFAYTQFFSIPDPNGFEYQISVNDSATLLSAAPRTGVPLGISGVAGNLLQVSQEIPQLDTWDNNKSIVFVTGLVPVRNELLPNLNAQDQNSNFSSFSMPILTDFDLNKTPSEPRVNVAQFANIGEYRMQSLISNTPMDTIDIQAFTQTYSGTLMPIYLPAGTNMNVKILFRRKVKK